MPESLSSLNVSSTCEQLCGTGWAAWAEGASLRAGACRQTSYRSAESPVDWGSSNATCAHLLTARTHVYGALSAVMARKRDGSSQCCHSRCVCVGHTHINLLLRENELSVMIKFVRLNSTLGDVAECA